MLVIRLARTGRAKYPTYRIVAAESSRPATGRFVEVLGHYNPHTKELVVKREETLKRLSQGAQPSNTVVKLLTRDKVELPAWVKLKTKAAKVDLTAVTPESETDVTETEAAADADADGQTAEGEDQAAEQPTSDAPALTDATRVATTSENAVVETADDNAVNVNDTDRTDTDDEAAAKAVAAQDAAAEAAGAKPASEK